MPTMKGAGAVQIRLKALAQKTKNAAYAAALSSAEGARSAAQSLVPVATGRLRASICVSEENSSVCLKARCPYAIWVERGTRYRPARPYLLPAARQADFAARAARAWKEALK